MNLREPHRPWPKPTTAWIMTQRWHELLFAHWSVDVEKLRSLLPKGLELDLYQGEAWLGVVPFRMSGIRLRGTPALPWLSAFPELNLRTYVKAGNKPGVLFFSLDAGNPAAVWIARKWFHLPYFHARMSLTPRQKAIHYKSQRIVRDPGLCPTFVADYGPVGNVYRAEVGSLEYWLTERYCLYTTNPKGELLRAEIHHEPWPLQKAEAWIGINTMADTIGIRLSGAPLCHYADFQEVIVWDPQKIG